jgi:isopenicillin N synthase-like dioxygenase
MATASVLTQPADRTTYEEAHNGAAAYLQSRLDAKDESLDKDFAVPVIDLAPSFSSLLSDRQAVADQIRKACTTSGFFYIANHGVSKHARDGILQQSKRFYDEMSLEQKEELHIKKSKLGLGWEPSEYTSIAGDQERKEGFNFSYEAALDPTGGDGLYRNLDGTDYSGNLWPKEEDLPGFYAAVKEYYGGVSCLPQCRLQHLLTSDSGSQSCSPSFSTLRTVA